MDVLSLVLATGTAIGAGTSVAMWLQARGDRGSKKRHQEIDQRLAKALAPIHSDLQGLHLKFEADSTNSQLMLKSAITEALGPLKDQLSIQNTKIEPLWKALEAMAVAQVQVLHQPDPARAEIDALLESLHTELEGGELMASRDYVELRGYLTQIKTWEPGQDLGFPVLAGEPTSAGILLSIMGLQRERRRQERAK